MNNRKTVSVFLSRPLLWIGIFVILVAAFLVFSVNFQRPEQAGAAAQVYGQGTPRFLAKWVGPSLPPLGDFTLSPGAVQCNSIGLNWGPGSVGADGYRVFKSVSGGPFSQIGTTAATFYPDGDVVQTTPYSYYIQAYRGADTKSSNIISITTPPCPPTVDLKCNGQNGPISGVASGYTCNLTWTSTDTPGPTPCTASGNFWSGPGPRAASNAVGESSLPITGPTTFTLICTGPGGSTAPLDFVDVSPSSLPLPGWIEIIPK